MDTINHYDHDLPQDAATGADVMVSTESYFDGKTIQLIGWNLLGILLTGITLGIGAPWAHCMLLRWQTRHTIVNGKRLCFTGRGLQLLGKYLLWGLLTVVTLGIYAIFIPVRMHKWRASHTRFATENDPPPKQTTSAGLILGVIGGIALILAIIIAAMLFFLPAKPQESISESSNWEQPQWQPSQTDTYLETTPITEALDEDTTQIRYVVANGGLNLRAGPGKEYEIVAKLPDGTKITVTEEQNGWVYNGEGWCSSDYLSPDAPTSNISGVDALIGSWLVSSDITKYDTHTWCRAGAITLNADGTFSHHMMDLLKDSNYGWHPPGGEDCPHWKGTYQFTGAHLILNYQFEEVGEYTYAEDGSPIYQGSHWSPVYKTVTLRVSMTDTGDLLLGYAADIPIYTENALPSAHTQLTLYRIPNTSDIYIGICNTLNWVFPN